MMRALKTSLRRFARNEDGQLIAEFALVIPLIFTIFLTSVELGLYSMRQMFLDRGLDLAVRQVRLNTNAQMDHAQIKQMTCDYAGFIENCHTQLQLEMNTVDLRNFTGLSTTVGCTDASQPVAPVTQFVNGGNHQMMLLRACYKFKPIFPTSGLGYEMAQRADGAGMAKMLSMTAFVQEPN